MLLRLLFSLVILYQLLCLLLLLLQLLLHVLLLLLPGHLHPVQPVQLLLLVVVQDPLPLLLLPLLGGVGLGGGRSPNAVEEHLNEELTLFSHTIKIFFSKYQDC